MRILRYNDRHFVLETQRDLVDVSLKLLNEVRNLGNLGESEQEFVEQITDAMDGDTAFQYLVRRGGVQLIAPEVL
ncbi:MAG: hypothetical protein LC650_00550 [Actinobacteria bacterium]|nr:hypothetical protein [Actinomycetota bacterium]